MFGMLGSLTKAVVGVVVEAPIALVADAIDLGGSINGLEEPRTVTALKRVAENVQNAVDPDK